MHHRVKLNPVRWDFASRRMKLDIIIQWVRAGHIRRKSHLIKD